MRMPIATKVGAGRSKPLSPELLVNMFIEKAPTKGVSEVVAFGTPGWSVFTSISNAPIRGMYRTLRDSTLYVVIGTALYTVNSAGTFSSSLGSIGGFGRVDFADNGDQICIVTNQRSYTYSVSGGFLKITSDEFPDAESVTFMNGFFIFNNSQATQRGQFFISSIFDGTVYDALDFATAERYPDNLTRVFADHSELILFGTDSIELWFFSGAADFPFARSQGSIIENGLGAKWSVQKLDASVLWLDEDGVVRRLEGNTPVRISTHVIEYLVALGDWTNAYTWVYKQEGHQFYVLTIPAATTDQTAGTYVYDAATQEWHIRKGFELDFYPLAFFVKVFGKYIAGDYATGTLYEMSLDCYQEAGNPLISEMRFPQVRNGGDRFIVHEFELDLEVGSITKQEVEAVTPPTPRFMYLLSNDIKDNIEVVSLPDGYDLTNAVEVDVDTDFSNQELLQEGMEFNSDGTLFFVVGFGLVTNQYSSATAYSLEDFSWDSLAYEHFDDFDFDEIPNTILLKNSDTKFYLATGVAIYEYDTNAPAAFDISALSYVDKFTPGGVVDILGFDLVNSGATLYILFADDTVKQYTLSTPYDITSASDDSKSYDTSSDFNQPLCIRFSTDETKMYIGGNSPGEVLQYSITNYDLDTLSLDAGEVYEVGLQLAQAIIFR